MSAAPRLWMSPPRSWPCSPLRVDDGADVEHARELAHAESACLAIHVDFGHQRGKARRLGQRWTGERARLDERRFRRDGASRKLRE